MRTKIVVTLGPSCESSEMIGSMIEAGMDIARMNFSHCTHEGYLARKRDIEAASKKLGKRVLILQDLQGPRIRVGTLPKEGRKLEKGETIVFSTVAEDDPDLIFIDNPYLAEDVNPGEPLYLANGEIELVIRKIDKDKIYAEVLRGGILFTKKGVNVPHTKLTSSGLTKKDIADIHFGLEHGADYIALSFVQNADDVEKAREIIGDKAKIISKIETALAIKNIDAIIQASDAIMVARGDLGIEIPNEQIPYIQKHIIRVAAWHNKGTITATQMLMSMIAHSSPTRAEVSDVANAVWDGTDAVMLSDESASGQYPLLALQSMARITDEAEKTYLNRHNPL